VDEDRLKSFLRTAENLQVKGLTDHPLKEQCQKSSVSINFLVFLVLFLYFNSTISFSSYFLADLAVPLSYPRPTRGGGRLFAAAQAGPPPLRQQRRCRRGRSRWPGRSPFLSPLCLAAAAALPPAVADGGAVARVLHADSGRPSQWRRRRP
jgi:hypothetical protein